MEVEQLGVVRLFDTKNRIRIPLSWREELNIDEHINGYVVIEGKTIMVYFDKSFIGDKKVDYIKSLNEEGKFPVPLTVSTRLNWHARNRIEMKAYSNKLITFRKI